MAGIGGRQPPALRKACPLPSEDTAKVGRAECLTTSVRNAGGGQQARNLLPGQTTIAQILEQRQVLPDQALDLNRTRRTVKVRIQDTDDLLYIALHAQKHEPEFHRQQVTDSNRVIS